MLYVDIVRLPLMNFAPSAIKQRRSGKKRHVKVSVAT
jgi:hypothetical protein